MSNISARLIGVLVALGAIVGGACAHEPDLLGHSPAGNGVTDTTATVQAADAAPGPIWVPRGTFSTTLPAGTLRGPFRGFGQIKDSAGNKRAPNFANVAAPPVQSTSHDSVLTAFNGDLSNVTLAIEHRITGAATLGQPVTGYKYTPEAYPVYIQLYNTSGWNNDTASNDGRTSAAGIRAVVGQYGQGDAVAFNGAGGVHSVRAGATHWFANPAVSLFNGDVSSSVSGAYLNPFELSLSDNGHDVAAMGFVVNMDRSNATGALGTTWGGVRLQSIGTAAVDTFVSGTGKADTGVEFTAADFGAPKAAVVLKRGDRFYLSGTNTDPHGLPSGVQPGGDYIVATDAGLEFYLGGVRKHLIPR